MAHRPNWRAVRVHRSYSVDEASRALGVAKVTVRRWIKHGGLAAIDDCKPTLILGRDLIAFGEKRRSRKQVCRLDQCFCMRCRAPRTAAYAQAELIESKGASAMVRMVCESCSAVMHKRVSWKQIEPLSALVSLSGAQRFKHLCKSAQPCVNDHLEKDV